MATLSKSPRSLCIVLVLLINLSSTSAFVKADCQPDGSPAVDSITCSGADTNGIVGGAGNDSITVNKEATVTGPIFGDGVVVGNGGDDLIINNGTTIATGSTTGTNGDLEGDVVGVGNGGEDVIVNNGRVAGDMDGDTALLNGGDDVLINNDTVGDDMDGDNARKNGGDDLIINNGMVGGDIQADDNEGAAGSVGGNDSIVINGIVEGSVDGDAGVKTGGNDNVMLQNGANGGVDHKLYIDGNDGDDTLIFGFIVPDQAALDALSQQIAAASPAKGSLTFNDQTFEWENFEHLDNEIVIKGMTGAFIITTADKTRAAIDPTGAAVYCLAGNLTAVGLDSVRYAEWLVTVKGADLKKALAKAASSKTTVTLAQTDGQTERVRA